jgi:Mce-associated membrane protein
MAESTTEQGSTEESARRDEVDLAKQTSDDADAETSVLSDADTHADPAADTADDAGSPEPAVGTEPAGKMRGRRARRAAASARAAEAGEAGSAEEAGTGAAATGTAGAATSKGRPGKAGRGGASGKPGKRAADVKAGPPATARGHGLSPAGLARLIVALAVIVVLLAAVLVFQLIKGPGNGGKLASQEDRREAARQAADTEIPQLFSYDYRQIDANIAQQENLTLGTINDQIRNQTAPALKSLAPKTTAVVQAVSLGSAVLSDDKQSVQVLVFVNQAVTSNLLPAPRLDRNRIVATMQLVNGQWKVADLKAL